MPIVTETLGPYSNQPGWKWDQVTESWYQPKKPTTLPGVIIIRPQPSIVMKKTIDSTGRIIVQFIKPR